MPLIPVVRYAGMAEVTDEEFDEYLDKTYGDVQVCDYVYPASKALKEIDPVAYRQSKLRYEAC